MDREFASVESDALDRAPGTTLGTVPAHVAAVEVIALRYALPPGSEYGSAKQRASVRTATLVRVETDGGVVGWGEAYGPPEPIAAVLRTIADEVVGMRVGAVRGWAGEHISRNWLMARAGVYTAAVSGLDIALWDAWARTLGVSLAHLLGGPVRDRVTAYASTGYSTDGEDFEVFRQSVRDAVDLGFTGVKIRVGFGVAEDERRIRAAVDELGADHHLMLDFNANYSADLALRTLGRVRDVDITWAEEPVPSEDLPGWTQIRTHTSVPLAGGEGLCTRFEFREPLSRRLYDIVQPDVGMCGGVTEMLAIANVASVWNVRVSPHVWGGAIGQAASLQIAALLPSFPAGATQGEPWWFEVDCGENPLREHLLVAPITQVGGFIAIPDGPGLGVDVDEAAVEEYATPDLRWRTR